MNVIFTCGGTAGHVNPALALAGLMQSRDPGVQILFVGSQRGMERRLIEKAGYAFRAIEIDNFRRSVSPAAIRRCSSRMRRSRPKSTSALKSDAVMR